MGLREALRTRYPRAWKLLIGRFAPGEYLGLHLTIGLGISLAGIWLFSVITEDVIQRDPITQFDLALLAWMHQHGTPGATRSFLGITMLGSPVVIGGVALATAVALAARREWLVLSGWVAALVGGGLLNQGLKALIRRPRPPGAAALLLNASWSFPSGHAMESLITYGMLAYVLGRVYIRQRPARRLVVIGAAILALSIGLSRLYLGVHYFSDVLAGYVAGLVWLSACISGVEVALRWRARDVHYMP